MAQRPRGLGLPRQRRGSASPGSTGGSASPSGGRHKVAASQRLGGPGGSACPATRLPKGVATQASSSAALQPRATASQRHSSMARDGEETTSKGDDAVTQCLGDVRRRHLMGIFPSGDNPVLSVPQPNTKTKLDIPLRLCSAPEPNTPLTFPIWGPP